MYFLYSPLSSLPQSPPSHSMFVAKLLIQYLTFTLLYLENIHPSFTQTPPFLNNNCFPNGVNLIPICSLYLAIFLPQLYHGLCHICRNSFHMRTPPLRTLLSLSAVLLWSGSYVSYIPLELFPGFYVWTSLSSLLLGFHVCFFLYTLIFIGHTLHQSSFDICLGFWSLWKILHGWKCVLFSTSHLIAWLEFKAKHFSQYYRHCFIVLRVFKVVIKKPVQDLLFIFGVLKFQDDKLCLVLSFFLWSCWIL